MSRYTTCEHPTVGQAQADTGNRLQIDEILKRLDDMDIHDISNEYLRYALRSKYAAGNTEKALDILLLHQRSESGQILPYDPNVQMVGAENRGNVTCYLDALLFAMFAKLEAFECMLKQDLPDESQRNLAALIRLWVNMLRSGKLIHTDMVCITRQIGPCDPMLMACRLNYYRRRCPFVAGQMPNCWSSRIRQRPLHSSLRHSNCLCSRCRSIYSTREKATKVSYNLVLSHLDRFFD